MGSLVFLRLFVIRSSSSGENFRLWARIGPILAATE
jgi:hypothetical protein